jgi:gamma-glutamyltranspeptidase/glutathione hydrolase
VHHDGRRNLVSTIDGRETAPRSASPALFLDAEGQPLPFGRAVPGGKSVGVPGNVALMKKAHRRWGKLPWAELFTPAIRLARDGFAVSPPLAKALASAAPLWADFPQARAIYWIDGHPAAEGETIRNPALAAFLETLARSGPDAFYKGDNAAAISAAVASAPHNPTRLTPPISPPIAPRIAPLSAAITARTRFAAWARLPPARPRCCKSSECWSGST